MYLRRWYERRNSQKLEGRIQEIAWFGWCTRWIKEVVHSNRNIVGFWITHSDESLRWHIQLYWLPQPNRWLFEVAVQIRKKSFFQTADFLSSNDRYQRLNWFCRKSFWWWVITQVHYITDVFTKGFIQSVGKENSIKKTVAEGKF